MFSSKLVIVLVAVLSVMTTLHPKAGVAGNALTPFLSPIIKGICNSTVWCGKGSCQISSDSDLGFECQCDDGWSQIEKHLTFLPCVIPNCSIDYSCSNTSIAPAPSHSPSLFNNNSVDPCMVAYCGGGTCSKTSTLEHKCDCKEGYSNLFNDTSFPCFNDCSLGANCSALGIILKNSSSNPSPPPSLSDSTNSSSRDGICNSSVWCGKGSCQVSSDTTFGFECQCDNGWSQIEEHLTFLPCVVPNCSINYSCSKTFIAPAPVHSPSFLNISSVDPCMFSYCGGGTCTKTSTFEHKCDCEEGYSNLFNEANFPCFSDCSLGESCSDLGITLKNSSRNPSSPPSLSDSTNSAGGVSFTLDKLITVGMLMCSVIFAVQMIV